MKSIVDAGQSQGLSHPSNEMIGKISQSRVEAMREMDIMKNEVKVRADADNVKIFNTAFYMYMRIFKGNVRT